MKQEQRTKNEMLDSDVNLLTLLTAPRLALGSFHIFLHVARTCLFRLCMFTTSAAPTAPCVPDALLWEGLTELCRLQQHPRLPGEQLKEQGRSRHGTCHGVRTEQRRLPLWSQDIRPVTEGA